MEDLVLEVKNLSVSYVTDAETVYAVDNLSFSLEKGKTLGLVGETGAGKTTIAKAIMQILPSRTARITDGEILINGQSVTQKSTKELEQMRGKEVAMIFQDPMSSLNPVETIGSQIYEALHYHNEEKKSQKELEDRVDEMLTLVGILPKRKHEYPHQFSGGMKQRALIAIALACRPEILIADEPTTALDVTIQAQVLQLMRDLRDEQETSMIMITHDLGVVALMCDYVAVVYAGEIVEYGTLEDIYSGSRHHPYTVGLFGAIPDLKSSSPRLNPVPGLMPDPTVRVPGCKFAPRCKNADERCRNEKPTVADLAGHRIMCHHIDEETSNESDTAD